MVEEPAGSYDIIVIGAGPAGSSAARAAAGKGAEVLLIDRRYRIGEPVQCGEWVPQWISRHADFSSKCVVQSVERMVTHLPDGKCYETMNPGYMIDRSLFDRELADAAVLAGVRFASGTRALGIGPEGVLFEQNAKKRMVRSKVIVGADGVHSRTARWAGRPPLKKLVALQYRMVLARPQDSVDIFFRRDCEGGYAWFFPKGEAVNVGMGVVPRKAPDLPQLMRGFVDELVRSGKLAKPNVISQTGGAIPCDLPERVVFRNVLLAGDAAGHAHPITGAGILHAVIGGEMAGRIAAEAAAGDDLSQLQVYEKEWREAFGSPLAYGATKRKTLEEKWNQPGIDFGNLIRETWVGFKEYFEERKSQR
jgi:geranylgeranyl reductase family protein